MRELFDVDILVGFQFENGLFKSKNFFFLLSSHIFKVELDRGHLFELEQLELFNLEIRIQEVAIEFVQFLVLSLSYYFLKVVLRRNSGYSHHE